MPIAIIIHCNLILQPMDNKLGYIFTDSNTNVNVGTRDNSGTT